MSELLNISVIREPENLSLKEISKIGFSSHPINLQSSRYKDWLDLCSKKEYKKVQVEMETFLKEKGSIQKVAQMPKDFQSIIKFSEYHGFKNLNFKEFAKQVDIRKIANEFDKDVKKKGCHSEKSPFFQLITNLSDQLVAITQVDFEGTFDFDLQGAIKTLKLVEIIFLNGKDKIRINLQKHFERPMIIHSCILDIDPCSLLPIKPESLPNSSEETKMITNRDGTVSKPNEKKCKCEEPKDDCACKCNDDCVDQNPCCVRIRPYVAELFVVKDETCKYEPGEISFIENVMESEIKVRKHRNLQREENYTEYEEENDTFEEKDLQVEEQFSLHKEVDKVVEQSLSIEAGASYNQSSSAGLDLGVITLGTKSSFNASLDTGYNWSKKEAQKQVQDESKNVISKAVSRVERKIRSLSTRKMINEIEEKNKHVFGGTEGAAKDLSRQFYYVNQIKKAQVYSHGKRSMLDFYLPEPSELLKRLVEKQFDLKKPEKPCINIEEIGTSKADWLEYVQCYGFTDLEMPPVPKPDITKTFPISHSGKGMKWNARENITFPVGYRAAEMWVDSRNFPASGSNRYVEFHFGNTSVLDHSGNGPDDKGPKLIDVKQSGEVFIEVHKLDRFVANLTIRFTQYPMIDFLPWQLKVHKLIMDKYKDDLDKYNEAYDEFQKSKENQFNKDPFTLSEMMKEQLKHAAISYITCQFFEDNDAMKHKVKGCGFPQMDLPESKREGEFVRFIEQAFEWKFMNYMLYPYFWGKKCSWEDKFKEGSDNHLFTKFLQSGFARVSISIRPGFESLVDYYLRTRRIWGFSGTPPIMGNSFVPIFQEIKESKANFNAEREGYLTWNLSLNKNEILLHENLDYYTEDLDIYGNPLGTYSLDIDKVALDLNREITFNCVTYRIVDIVEVDTTRDIIKFVLDRELEVDCCCSGKAKDKEEAYLGKELSWSTGALFVGSPWKFTVPTSLTWLREESGCLPCYPIECE